MGFHVGDLVRGIGNTYGITNENMTLGVVKAVRVGNENIIRVRVLEHLNNEELGFEDWVDSQYFELIDTSWHELSEPSRSEFDLLFE